MLPTSTVGKKLLMTVTGQAMILFIILHLAGNAALYRNSLNAYSAVLHALPVLLWTIRLFLGAMLCLHVFYGIALFLENRKSKPQAYAVQTRLSATFAGRTMIWTGAVIALFLTWHLPHFTLQIIDPSSSAARNADQFGRPDMYMMVVRGFQNPGIVFFYLFSLTSLLLHLSHGIQSSVQTWGCNNDKTLPIVTRMGILIAVALFLGYAALPAAVATGMLK